ALAAWGFFARRPALYALATKLAVRVLERAGGSAGGVAGMLGRMPFAGGWARGWTATRDIPAPAGRTFRELYAASRTHLDPSSTR
ncbi:lactate utilisation protein LutB domain-containing protein, partial [Burkholderia pseudomallei]